MAGECTPRAAGAAGSNCEQWDRHSTLTHKAALLPHTPRQRTPTIKAGHTKHRTVDTGCVTHKTNQNADDSAAPAAVGSKAPGRTAVVRLAPSNALINEADEVFSVTCGRWWRQQTILGGSSGGQNWNRGLQIAGESGTSVPLLTSATFCPRDAHSPASARRLKTGSQGAFIPNSTQKQPVPNIP